MCRAKGPYFRRCPYHRNPAVMAIASAKQSTQRLQARLEKLEGEGADDRKLKRGVDRLCDAYERLGEREQATIPALNQEKGEPPEPGAPTPLPPPRLSAADSITAETIERLSWDEVAEMAGGLWDDPEAAEKLEILVNEREARESQGGADSTGWPGGADSTGWPGGTATAEQSDWVSDPTARPNRKLTPHEIAREQYESYVYAQHARMESELSFHLNAEGNRKRIDTLSLFSGPVSRVKKYGSEELQSWFARNGRETLASFRHGLFGWNSDAKAARNSRLESFDNVAHVG